MVSPILDTLAESYRTSQFVVSHQRTAIKFLHKDQMLIKTGQGRQVLGLRFLRLARFVRCFTSALGSLDCYNSADYQHAKSIRTRASIADIIVVEGYDGVQG